MLTKAEFKKRRRTQTEETLDKYLKKTLPTTGYTKEWNTEIYRKFEDILEITTVTHPTRFKLSWLLKLYSWLIP